VWSDSYSLYQILNTYYLNQGNATGESICVGTVASDCDYRVKGISQYYRNMIENVYWNTGAGDKDVTTSAMYAEEILTQNVGGKIGLINASDFGYAAPTRTAVLSSYRTNASSDWVYGYGYEWTLTPDSTDSAKILRMDWTCKILSYSATSTGSSFRPALFLNSSVYVVSGDGSESNPYQIAMTSN
jgi:hypothetical protein